MASAFDELQKDDVITEVDDELIIGEPLSAVHELLSGPLGAEVVLAFSRLDKKTLSKQRCSAVVLFDYKPRPVNKTEYALHNDSSWGEPGVLNAVDALGLKVTGFITGSSAASSGLQIGDVIIEVEGELLMGLSSALAFEKMTGDRNTEVALTAIRNNPTTGGKERVYAYVLRDVGTSCKVVGRPGFDAVLEPCGLRVTSIVSGCSVIDTDLMLGDIITSINEDLIPGMTIEEAWPLLWGEMKSSVELMITRLVGGVKSRLTIDAVRDHNPSSEVPKPPKSNFSTAMVQKLLRSAPALKSSAPVKSSSPVVQSTSIWNAKMACGMLLVLFLLSTWIVSEHEGVQTGPAEHPSAAFTLENRTWTAMELDNSISKAASSFRDSLKLAEIEDVVIDQAAAVSARRREELSAAVVAARNREKLSAEWEKRKREHVLQERRELFFFMDIDQSHPSSGLSLRELRAVLKKNGDYNNEAALKQLFGAMDADGSGDISFEEADAYEDRANEDDIHSSLSLLILPSMSRHCAAAARHCLFKDISTPLALKEAAGASDTCAAAARQCLLLSKSTASGKSSKSTASGKSSAQNNPKESKQDVVQAIGYAASAAVTSGVGYGLYWMVTQGD